jgi:hypothetical protein
MKRHRRNVLTLALVGATFCLIAPSANAGSPILSGYGGPGAGEQEILGSHLLNVPSGAGSSGPSAGTPSAQAQAASSSETTSAQTRILSTNATSSTGDKSTNARAVRPRHAVSTRPSIRSRPERLLALSRASSNTSANVSSGLLLVAFLVAGALLGVALLTRRLSKLEP